MAQEMIYGFNINITRDWFKAINGLGEEAVLGILKGRAKHLRSDDSDDDSSSSSSAPARKKRH